MGKDSSWCHQNKNMILIPTWKSSNNHVGLSLYLRKNDEIVNRIQTYVRPSHDNS